MKEQTNLAESFSIPTGPVRAEALLLRPIMYSVEEELIL
jgi:hypothetical protein